MKRVLLIAGLGLLGTLTAVAAAPKAAAPKFPMAADGTTNIADCAKAPAEARDACISRARPVTGKEIYAKLAAEKSAAGSVATPKVAEAAKPSAIDKAKRRAAAKAAKLAEIKANKERVASAPKGLKVNGDGTTNIQQCALVVPSLLNECISRARPMTAKALAAFTQQRTAAEAKAAAKKVVADKAAAAKAAAKAAATAAVSKVPTAKAAPAATTTVAKTAPAPATKAAVPATNLKGFKIAKDGTTDIADCANAKADFKNECISRARPVKGSQIYGATR